MRAVLTRAAARGKQKVAKADGFHTRETAKLFTVVFYGLKIFDCKTAQFCATRCECETAEHVASATLRKAVKIRAKSLS